MDRQVVMLEWQDACSVDEWSDEVEARVARLASIVSVGFLVAEHEDRIVLALNWDSDNKSYSQFIAVPKPWVLKQVSL